MRNQNPLTLALLSLGLVASPVGASGLGDPGEPQFDLIGSTTQKVTEASTEWDEGPSATWAFTADLKPRFTYGPASFRADTTWTLPLSASLVAEAPRVAVYEAYFRVTALEGLDLTLGQKRLALGVGQRFTVGDSINPVVGLFDQKTGFRGVTAEWSPVSWASVSSGLSVEGDGAEGALQASVLLGEVQVTASTVAGETTFNPALGLSADVFGVILTSEAAVEFLPQGVRPRSSLPWEAPEAWTEPVPSASVGARWEPSLGDWDWSLSAEYLHWGQGWSDAETHAWEDAGRPPAPGAFRSRENAFFRLAASTGGTVSASAFATVDLQDSSALGQGLVTWAPWDNLEVLVELLVALGDEGTAWEFVNPQHHRYQTSLALTYHF